MAIWRQTQPTQPAAHVRPLGTYELLAVLPGTKEKARIERRMGVGRWAMLYAEVIRMRMRIRLEHKIADLGSKTKFVGNFYDCGTQGEAEEYWEDFENTMFDLREIQERAKQNVHT